MPKAQAITNVHVNRNSTFAPQYSLGWHTEEARYHIWLSADEHRTPEPIIFKNSHAVGHFDTRKLELKVTKNRAMFDAAMAEAVAGKLFEQCEEKLAREEKERVAKNRSAYLQELQRQAGPEMFKVLKAISEYWSTGDLPMLSPGAQLLEGHEPIGDAVKRVILLAETGGKVEL